MNSKIFRFFCGLMFILVAVRGFAVGDNQLACDAGSYGSGGACQPCPVGTYSNTTNATSCTPCPEGTFAAGTGSASCTVCDNGTISASEGATECTPCPSGFTTFGEDRKHCFVYYEYGSVRKKCTPGYCCGNGERYKCKKGTYADAGVECAKALQNSYQQSSCGGGTTRGGGQCVIQDMYVYQPGACEQCPSGCTTEGIASQLRSDCTVVTAKQFCVGNECFSWPDEIAQSGLASGVATGTINWSCPNGINQQ